MWKAKLEIKGELTKLIKDHHPVGVREAGMVHPKTKRTGQELFLGMRT